MKGTRKVGGGGGGRRKASRFLNSAELGTGYVYPKYRLFLPVKPTKSVGQNLSGFHPQIEKLGYTLKVPACDFVYLLCLFCLLFIGLFAIKCTKQKKKKII